MMRLAATSKVARGQEDTAIQVQSLKYELKQDAEECHTQNNIAKLLLASESKLYSLHLSLGQVQHHTEALQGDGR